MRVCIPFGKGVAWGFVESNSPQSPDEPAHIDVNNAMKDANSEQHDAVPKCS